MMKTTDRAGRFHSKPVDNLHTLDLHGLRLQSTDQASFGTPYALIDRGNGEIGYGIPKIGGNRTIVLRPDSDNSNEWEASNLTRGIALAAALVPTPSAFEPAQILVYGGVYFETTATTFIPGIAIIGAGYTATVFVLVAPVTTWMSMSAQTFVSDVSFASLSLCTNVITADSAAVIEFQKVAFYGTGTRYFNIDSAQFFCWYVGWYHENPNEVVADVVNGGYFFTDAGLGVPFDNTNIFCNLSTAAQMYSRATLLVGYKHIVVGTGTCQADTLSQGMVTTDACFKGIGAGPVFSSFQCLYLGTTLMNDFSGETEFHLNIDTLDPSTIDYTTLTYDKTTLIFANRTVESERGTHIAGTLVIGDHDFPSRSYFGEGGSNTRGAAYFEFDGVSFIDYTVDLSADNPALVTLFSDLTNSIFYIGHDFRSTTMVLKNTIAYSTGTIVIEYWDGGAWVITRCMVSNDQSPYNTYGETFLQRANAIEDLRLAITLDQGTNWQKTTVNGINEFWIRLRITSTLNVSPVLDYIRLISSSTSIQEDGQVHHYGLARSRRNIVFDTNLFVGVGASKPLDQDIYVSTNVSVGRTGNRFKSNDFAGFSFFVPSDVDTGCPVTIEIAYCTNGTDLDDVNMQLDISTFGVGEQVYFSSAGTPATTTIESQTLFTLTPDQTNPNNLVISEAVFNLSGAVSANAIGVPTQLIMGRIGRIVDSNSDDLVILQLSLFYYTWRTSQIAVI
jgi:hypothetical protein